MLQEPIAKAFVGSNPTLCTKVISVLYGLSIFSQRSLELRFGKEIINIYYSQFSCCDSPLPKCCSYISEFNGTSGKTSGVPAAREGNI